MLDGKGNDVRQDEHKNNADPRKQKPSATFFFRSQFRATQSGIEVLNVLRDIGYITRCGPHRACTHILRTLHGLRIMLSASGFIRLIVTLLYYHIIIYIFTFTIYITEPNEVLKTH